jgi:hypothetical protein
MPTQTYQSHSYSLGDWMGNNADRLYLFTQYVPLPKLKIKLWYQEIRKGEAGTLDQQYYAVPQPQFLFKKLFDYKEAGFLARYEFINRLMLTLELNSISIQYVNAASKRENGLKLGFSYGL